MRKWLPLLVLSIAMFIIVIDMSVMNVAISTLVEEFDTNVTVIQTAITAYALVSGSLMMLGAKLGDRIGRRNTLVLGAAIYGVGTTMTALSANVYMLMFGWSVLEGIGAALMLPTLYALAGGTYKGPDRAMAFSIIGALAGIGVAVGPIVGGWLTTNMSWRVVFAIEAVLVIVILALHRNIIDTNPKGISKNKLDLFGGLLTVLGLGLAVYALLQAGTWGFIEPRSSPIEPFGLSLTPFVFLFGLFVLWLFVQWERFLTSRGREPLLDLTLFRDRGLTSAVSYAMIQNILLGGTVFGIPLFLQVTLGLSAFETGVQMIPLSVAVFLASIVGAQMAVKVSPRSWVRIALVILLAANLVLLGTIDQELSSFGFGLALALVGAGVGMMGAMLGNLGQSSVSERSRSEVGGLQNTASSLGTSIGTALIGAIVIAGLAASFTTLTQLDPEIPAEVSADIEIAMGAGVSFAPSNAVEAGLLEAGASPELTEAVVAAYSESQLNALRVAFLATSGLVVIAFLMTGILPTTKLEDMADPDDAAPAPTEV